MVVDGVSQTDLTDDEVDRIDLGSLIITPVEQMGLELVGDQETGLLAALRVHYGQSGLQMQLLAAPVSDGFAAEIREGLVAEVEQVGGQVSLAKGPFGTELRRVIPVQEQDGEMLYAPLREWLVEGPAWLLLCRLLGAAALDFDHSSSESEVLEEFVRNTIVRRDDKAMVPGTLLPLTAPTTEE